jgi:hypothetical protein
MKGSEQFKQVIQQKLSLEASVNSEFHAQFHNPQKDIDSCVSYILNKVQESGVNGFADQEVYDMAFEYYRSDSTKVESKANGRVVVNHHVELSEEEKAEARKAAVQEVIAEEKKKLKTVTKAKVENPEIVQASLF